MIRQHDLLRQREAIQEDLLTMLDGMEQEFLDAVCQMVVERFDILLSKVEGCDECASLKECSYDGDDLPCPFFKRG